MSQQTRKAARYSVHCALCYNQGLETSTKRLANLWATAHGNQYGHAVLWHDAGDALHAHQVIEPAQKCGA